MSTNIGMPLSGSVCVVYMRMNTKNVGVYRSQISTYICMDGYRVISAPGRGLSLFLFPSIFFFIFIFEFVYNLTFEHSTRGSSHNTRCIIIIIINIIIILYCEFIIFSRILNSFFFFFSLYNIFEFILVLDYFIS